MGTEQQSSQGPGGVAAGSLYPDEDVKKSLEQAFLNQQAGLIDDAEKIYRGILKKHPNNAVTLNFLGLLFHQKGDNEGAVDLISKAVENLPADQPSTKAVFLNNLGSVHGAMRHVDAATDAFKKSLEIDPNFQLALRNLGNAYVNQGEFEGAVRMFRRLTTLDPHDEISHCKLAETLTSMGNLDEAVKLYRDALEIDPEFSLVLNNLGVTLVERGDVDEAVTCFRRALEITPDDAAAHCNLANALREQGNLDEAEQSIREAIRLEPGLDLPYTQLGLLQLARGEIEEASESFLTPVFTLRYPDDDVNQAGRFDTFNRINKQKVLHDLEQLNYLADRGLLDDDLKPLIGEYQSVFNAHPELEECELSEISPGVSELFRKSYNRMLHYSPAPMIEGDIINPEIDTAAVEAEFHNSDPHLALVDDLLSQEALEGLRDFALESTVWYNISATGDVGANFEHGFCCPLLLQIADGYRKAFPSVFGDLMFTSCWSFKYYERRSGDGLHGDSGRRNLNLWITPDDANRDKTTGGLTFWNKKVPMLEVKDSPKDVATQIMRDIISEPDARGIKVPYGCNRGALFESNIIHETDVLDFEPGYENRRINITFVFGMPDL